MVWQKALCSSCGSRIDRSLKIPISNRVPQVGYVHVLDLHAVMVANEGFHSECLDAAYSLGREVPKLFGGLLVFDAVGYSVSVKLAS